MAKTITWDNEKWIPVGLASEGIELKEVRFAIAVALFDAKGMLLAATESSNIGSLSPGETKEIKMTFREVKRKFFEAKTAQIALETYK